MDFEPPFEELDTNKGTPFPMKAPVNNFHNHISIVLLCLLLKLDTCIDVWCAYHKLCLEITKRHMICNCGSEVIQSWTLENIT